MPGISLDIAPNSDLHRRVIFGVMARVRASKAKMGNFHKKWKEAEDKAVAFLPERETDAKRRVEREAGKPNYTTIQIPYSYAVLMASHTYWTTVFMSRTPVLQYTGRHGETQQQIQALEALMDYQVQVGEMLVPWYIWLMDVGKYGFGVIGNFWEERFSYISEIKEEEQFLAEQILGQTFPTGRKKKVRRTVRVPGYHGNRVYNVRPFDFYPDPRVPLHLFQKGEFCAVYNEIGWNEVMRRAERGIYINIKEARRSAKISTERDESGSSIILPDIDLGQTFDLEAGGQRKPLGAEILSVYECYIELVPSDWGLGDVKMPVKWVFTVTSDFKLVIGAQPLGAMHDKFPFDLIEFEPEGYAFVNRGIPQIMEPIQNTIDWLINSHFYNVRKALNNQFVVDPSRVVMKDALDPLPGNMIRLRPAAYGGDARTALHQLEVQDVTRTHLTDMRMMLGIGERVSGVNDQIMGMLNTAGRKTATEVRTSSSFGINRLKTNSEYFSAMGWAPMSQMFVQNSQQYYDSEMKFRIVGDLVQEAGPRFVQVTPELITGFYDFVPVDGTLPIDRFAQANLWKELFAQIQNIPQVMASYDIGRIFAWVAQLAGLKNINQFRIQVQPDEQLLAQAQSGNVLPMPTSSGPDGTRVPTRPVSNVGVAG